MTGYKIHQLQMNKNTSLIGKWRIICVLYLIHMRYLRICMKGFYFASYYSSGIRYAVGHIYNVYNVYIFTTIHTVMLMIFLYLS